MKEIYITDSEREKCRKVADAFAELYEIENILSWMREDTVLLNYSIIDRHRVLKMQ